MADIVIIMNPCAGTKKANRFLADIIKLFAEHGYHSHVYITSKKGDGVELAKNYAKNGEILVAIGGDGTLNEVIEGITLAGVDIPIGYIPAGSTNDFANSLKIPKNILNAAQHIMDGEAVYLDTGIFNKKVFTYVASFGAFTRIAYSTPQNFKNAFGHFAYFLQGIKDLSSIKSEHLIIETDTGKLEGDYLFGAVCNSTSVGGILTIDPAIVDLSDGLLELVLIKQPKNMFELNQLVLSLNGQIYDCEMISLISSRAIKIHCENKPDWTLDGEYEPGVADIEIRNSEKAFRIILKK